MLSPCGFQAVRRDRQRPCSITTVRFQLSATTVATTCRANTLPPFLVQCPAPTRFTQPRREAGYPWLAPGLRTMPT
jgi:hypothetical protein